MDQLRSVIKEPLTLVAAIDLNKITSEIADISGGFPDTPGMISNWAKKDLEVLIRDYIPPEAILWSRR